MNYFDPPTPNLSQLLRIIATPLGDAPQWVREAWVGVVIPLLDDVATAQEIPVVSVYDTAQHSGMPPQSNATDLPHGTWRGYTVLAIDAFDALQVLRPDAAEWWFENLPHLLDPNQYFVFDELCGVVQSLGEPK